MSRLWIALIAAAFAAVTFTAAAADNQPYTAQPPRDKPGRAADDSKDVKAGGPSTKPGRAADESAPKKSKKKKKKDGQS